MYARLCKGHVALQQKANSKGFVDFKQLHHDSTCMQIIGHAVDQQSLATLSETGCSLVSNGGSCA